MINPEEEKALDELNREMELKIRNHRPKFEIWPDLLSNGWPDNGKLLDFSHAGYDEYGRIVIPVLEFEGS